jgi:hypothetical protein
VTDFDISDVETWVYITRERVLNRSRPICMNHHLVYRPIATVSIIQMETLESNQ